MKNPFLHSLLSLLATASLSQAVMITESSAFDFSDDPANPTDVLLDVGANRLEFIIGMNSDGGTGATNGSDADIFTLVLPENGRFTSIFFASNGSDPGSHFFGFRFDDSFPTASEDPNSAFAMSLDNNPTRSPVFGRNTELINLIGPVNPRPTFEDDISVFVQETANTAAVVVLEINVEQVPEPSSLLLLGLSGGLLFRRKR